MIIVPFEEKYISAIADIEKECFSVPWSEKSLKEELENEQAFFLVCLKDNEVAGYIGIIDICGECNITNVAVGEKFRNKGVASALIKKAIDDAIERNSDFITLEVRKSNTPALNLYNKHGFEKVGERRNFYTHPTEDAVLMTKYFKEEV